MILSRMIEHVKKQQWTGAVIELAIVILGVFIGLQANNWNTARHDRAAEIVYLHSLVRDLDSIQSTVQRQIDFENRIAKYIGQSLNEISAKPSRDRTTHLSMLLGQLTARSTLKIESPTFKELQSSGRLGLIRDPILRGKIVKYFYLIQRWESGLDQNNTAFIDNGFNVFLRDSGMSFIVWNQQVMHEPPLLLGDTFEKLMKARYGDHFPMGTNAILSSPSASPFWDRLRQQLNWRATIAGYNEVIAMRLKKMTAVLRTRVVAYLKGH